MVSTDTSTPCVRDEIIQLNIAFADRERHPTTADQEWYRAHLADGFIFRRGDGNVVGKESFILGLIDLKNESNYLDAAVLDVALGEQIAAAKVAVALNGIRGGKQVDGVFLNRRLFRNCGEGHGWQCLAWWNEEIGGRTSSQGPVDEATPVLARTK